jgi:uncharacterized protein YbjT (DUF2867 family)
VGEGREVLLTGATGFVGGALAPRLVASGWRVRALTRNLGRVPRGGPDATADLSWVTGDVARVGEDARLLEGVTAAFYLVHAMTEGPDFARREVDQAGRFADAAGRAGVGRIVYLGGIAPAGPPSPHLASRLAVGETLRRGPVPTIELRASMIVGRGSLSWLIVRDLAARLPVMVLPSWLRSRTQPVAIDDVVAALAGALDLPLGGSASFDLPGPDVLSGHEILDEAARQMQLPRPHAVEVPLLTPRLSSHWVRFVTRAQWAVAREVIVGLTHDVLARDDLYWGRIGRDRRLTFAEAVRRALTDEPPAPGPWGAVERLLRRRGHRLAHA